MLNREDRFFAPSGGIYPGGPSIWHVIDWDQRRLISVKMDEELESEEPAFRQLLKHIDTLPPDVYLIHVSADGHLFSSSTDPEDDETLCVWRPPLDTAQLPEHVETISREGLQEVARVGPRVDLVTRQGSNEQFIFKYCFLFHDLSAIWHEMSLWCRLQHPNIVPFDKVVVDELEGGLVGFTTKFIPGGTLDKNKSREFKLKWLHQLIAVVDHLNLRLGVAHQDVAARNLLVDEATDNLLLFDFDYSARIGYDGCFEARNDIKGVFFTMFEVITGDQARRGKRHEDQDLSEVVQMEWVQHPDSRLDHPVSVFRQALDDWREQRRTGTQITEYLQAPDSLDWPPLPDPPLTEVEIHYQTGTVKEMQKLYDWRRTDLLKKGKAILPWQRPPQQWPEATPADSQDGCE